MSTNGLPTNELSDAFTVLATYASMDRAERARAQLQTAGIPAQLQKHAADAADEPQLESGPDPAARIELRGRVRDHRKARAVLKAMHLLPASKDTSNPETDQPSAPADTTASAPPRESQRPARNTDEEQPGTPSDDEPEAEAEAESSTADKPRTNAPLLSRISFWQMVVWGAALLALATLLLVLFGGQA